jgi:hypothetical protein
MTTGIHTNITTATRAQTAVHVTGAVMDTFQNVLASLGLSSRYLDRHWDTIETGLKAWIDEGSLEHVQLECGDARDPDAVFLIPLSYRTAGNGDLAFVTSHARVVRALAKLESVPAGTDYRVVVKTKSWAKELDGWSSTTAADTSGLSSYELGGVAGAPHASASLTYFHRS